MRYLSDLWSQESLRIILCDIGWYRDKACSQLSVLCNHTCLLRLNQRARYRCRHELQPITVQKVLLKTISCHFERFVFFYIFWTISLLWKCELTSVAKSLNKRFKFYSSELLCPSIKCLTLRRENRDFLIQNENFNLLKQTSSSICFGMV